MKKKEQLINIYISFIIYSFLGWIIETVHVSMLSNKLVKRGYLTGPLLPIYGFGAIIITLTNKDSKNVFEVFLKSIIAAGILEYFTSYIIEAIFNIRLWDYSLDKYNIAGRIQLKNLLIFGALGVVVVYITEPFINNRLNNINFKTKKIFTTITLTILLIDFIVSTTVIYSLNNKVAFIKKEQLQITKQHLFNCMDKKCIISKTKVLLY